MRSVVLYLNENETRHQNRYCDGHDVSDHRTQMTHSISVVAASVAFNALHAL